MWNIPLIVVALVLTVFSAPVTAVSKTCAANDTETTHSSWKGVIRSPGFGQPNGYPPNQLCHWSIDVGSNETSESWKGIKFKFSYYNMSDCEADSVKIIDGIGVPLYCAKCGELGNCSSNANSAQVEFMSDGEGSGPGFVLNYQGFCKVEPIPKVYYPGGVLNQTQTDTCAWTVAPGTDFMGLFIFIQPKDETTNWVFLYTDGHTSSQLKAGSHWSTSHVDLQFQPLNQAFNPNSNLTVASFNLTHPCFRNVCGSSDCIPLRGLGDTYKCDPDVCHNYECDHGGRCYVDGDKAMCNCSEGHLGQNCSVEDYCHAQPCVYGNCTNMPSGPVCTCPDGYSGNTCSDRNYCADNPCQHGDCVHDATRYTCNNCPPEFMGKNCSEANDGSGCQSGEDTYLGSGINWAHTVIGATDSQPCPGALGNATRQCIENKDISPSTAYWDQPDLSGCVSERFHNIFLVVQALSEASTIDADQLMNVTESIVAAMTPSDEDARLYAGDLGMATRTVEQVAHIFGRTNTQGQQLSVIAQSYGDAVATIVDPSTGAVWRYTKSGYLEARMMSLLQSLEQLSANLADKTSATLLHRRRRDTDSDSVDASINVTTSNLDFYVRVLDRGANFTGADLHTGSVSSSLSIPGEIFRRAASSTTDPYIHFYHGRFTSLSELLEETNSHANTPSKVTSSGVLNSDILATRVLNAPEQAFQSLTDPIRLEFSLQNDSQSESLQQNCIFLNMTATSDENRWLRSGCVRSESESNASHVVCYCSHMTNFAVLMDMYGASDDVDDVNTRVLTYLSYAGGALSVLGCVVSIAIFQFFRLTSERIRVHEQLALSIILVQLFFLVGIDRTENKAVCKAMAICLHYSLVALFCWMLVEGANLYLVLVKVFKSRSHLKKYIAIGWGIPLVVVGISAGIFHEEYGTGSICWLSNKVLLVAFVPAVGLVVVINSAILLVVMKTMMNSLSKGSKVSVENRSSVRVGLKAAAVLLPLLGLTWTFGFLSIDSKGTLIFTYLFTIFNSLQGVFFFVFHCLFSVDVQNAYDRRSRRRSQLRLTESSFSVRDRKRSNGSMYSSSYGKDSIHTVWTDAAHSTLERKRSPSNSPYNNDVVRQQSTSSSNYGNDVVRPQSVTFDDDVFLPGTPPHRHSLHGRTGGSFHNVVNPMPDVIDGGGAILSTAGSVFGDIRRRSASETNGYMFYYGKGSKKKNNAGPMSGIDKNDLYASVNK